MRRRRRPPAAAAPGGFLHLSLLSFLRRSPSSSLKAHAQLLLHGLPLPPSAAASLLRPHLLSGNPHASLRLFKLHLQEPQETFPNSFAFSAALAACSRLPSPGPGLAAHSLLLKSGFASDVFALTSLANFYSAFGLRSLARILFDEMPVKDSASFNAVISANARDGCAAGSFAVFGSMLECGFRPDGFTFMALIAACAGLEDAGAGRAVHGLARKMLRPEEFASGRLMGGFVDLYVKCRVVRLARRVFDLMGERRDVRAWSAMVSGYAKCGQFDLARKMFDEMPEKDLIAWNTLIGGFSQAGRHNEVLALFEEMEKAGFEPDEVTMVRVLTACAHIGAIHLGKRLQLRVEEDGSLCRNPRLARTIVDMHAKHGSMQTALDVFHRVGEELKTVELFNTMILGLAQHGLGEKAVSLFEGMQVLGLRADAVTFMGVLQACSRSGLVTRGCQIFDSMVKYGIRQDMGHYACMVDLLARAGQLDDAYRLIQSMPFEADGDVLLSLLRACRIHRNTVIGKIAKKRLLQLDPGCKDEKLHLSKLFSDDTRKKRAKKARKVIDNRLDNGWSGDSYIEWNGIVHQFSVIYTPHLQAKAINLMLRDMSRQLRFSARNDNKKKVALGHHSEKVALAFGLINSAPGTTIKIMTNYRMCGSCHSSFKYLSKIYSRDISVNDGIALHEMKQGLCSCKDYW